MKDHFILMAMKVHGISKHDMDHSLLQNVGAVH
jgi:hypothetical protein